MTSHETEQSAAHPTAKAPGKPRTSSDAAPGALRVQFPAALAMLFEPHRYKVAYGGRGGLKSWGAADALLIQGVRKPLRVLCARENMNSIAESVHHLLETRARDLGLSAAYTVEKARIIGANGTEFIFAGLRHNVGNIKSLEAVDIVWVEEADQVSRDSWQTLIPTIRKDGSEIWVTFNPKLDTDDTYKRFVINPPPGACVVRTDYRDNPWLPEVLRVECEYMRVNDPKAYQHVWLGECLSAAEGAIFSDQIAAMEAEGRLTSVPCDRMRPVDTFWDLGYGDTNAIWMMQPVGGWYNVVDYLEDRGKTIADYVVALQQRGYVYGTHYVPHDGVDAQLHHRMTGDATKSVEQLMRAAGLNVRVAAKMAITDRINAARTIFGQVRIDATKCADGVQGLRHYQWGELNSNGEARRSPLHNWASHPADAFCTMAVSAKQPARVAPKPAERPRAAVGAWA